MGRNYGAPAGRGRAVGVATPTRGRRVRGTLGPKDVPRRTHSRHMRKPFVAKRAILEPCARGSLFAVSGGAWKMAEAELAVGFASKSDA